ncbi:lytic transglycosylase domain-containing protein [Mangrovicella endophytica]|uniref:lytic transglycosylase domain-containing protein n=1 Tax=Mangrovicella endophytica TaxID=2066697 RepID=UPI003CC957ED
MVSAAPAQEWGLPLLGPVPSAKPMATDSGIAFDPSRFGSAPAVRAANPIPAMRAPAPAPMPGASSAFTASISSMSARPSDLRPVAGELRDGLQALASYDVRKARSIREGMMPGSLDRHILAWAIALQGGKDVPAVEIARAASELDGWPGMKTLRANSEKALYREQPPARDVVAAFSSTRPETPEGAMALARAYLEFGQAGKAKALIAGVWRNEKLDAGTEKKILDQFGSLLTRGDHKYRMDKLLYSERVTDAGRVAGMAGARELYAARAAVIRGDSKAAALMKAVPSSQRGDPGYLLAQVELLRKADKVEDAARVLLKAPRDRDTLVDPDAWWNERRIIARDLLDLGRTRDAYRIAAAHSAENSTEAVEAEFHAGWIALRFLNDPSTASKHFARIAELSAKPLSRSRSYYWLGRAAEAGGSGSAGGYYSKAAHYGATFYGQLAAARLGHRPQPVVFPKASDAERRRFESREAVRAIRRLEQIGFERRANILYNNLADELDSPGELALLSVMAERRGDHHLVLQVGKQAYWRGVDAPALAFPIGVIPASANISASGKALAYAIARQESAFNPSAKSGAGALGLLQLMPGTAKTVAKKAGMSYSADRLISDPGYNATLGSRFLGEQIDNFDGSYVLTFAAYNAGPRRAREWIGRFGDPRGQSIDQVVDWIERIPFTETRNYVQRVMENYQVYKMRLGAPVDVEQDLRYGRQG